MSEPKTGPPDEEPEGETLPSKVRGILEIAKVRDVRTEYWRRDHMEPFH